MRGKLSKMNHKTLGALTVIDVHQKDSVTEMVEKDVDNGNAFAEEEGAAAAADKHLLCAKHKL